MTVSVKYLIKTLFCFVFGIEKIWVKCNQIGKKHKVPFCSLSMEDGSSVTQSADLAEGQELLLEYGKKSYEVTIFSIENKLHEETEGTFFIMLN